MYQLSLEQLVNRIICTKVVCISFPSIQNRVSARAFMISSKKPLKIPDLKLCSKELLSNSYVLHSLMSQATSLILSCNFDKLLCAAVECFGINKEDCFPPIKVIEGKEDIVVKMSDEGGGIPRSAVPLICT